MCASDLGSNSRLAKLEISQPNFAAIPEALKALSRWVGWRSEARNGQLSKVPLCVPLGIQGQRASVTNPDHWGSFQDAIQFCRDSEGTAGIGFVLGDPFLGVDLDDCRTSDTGEIDAWAREIIDSLDSYTEVSPSGTGVKIICQGRLPQDATRHRINGLGSDGEGGIEVYDRDRYFTITGEHLPGSPPEVREREAAIAAVYRTLFFEKEPASALEPVRIPNLEIDEDEIVLVASTQNDRFRSLFFDGDLSHYGNDHSRADQALCNILAFYCGPDSDDQIDRLFRTSALMRDKWDRDDYRARTIRSALDSVDNFYNWSSIRQNQVVADKEQAAIAFVSNSERDDMQSALDMIYEEADQVGQAMTVPKKVVFQTWDETCAIAAEQFEDWLIRGWLEFGCLGLITGLPFSGKSSLVADILAAIANGQDFCGIEVQSVPFILFDFENKERILVERIRKALAGNEGQISKFYHRVPPASVQSPLTAEVIRDTIATLRDQIGEVASKVLLIIDTFRSAFAGGPANELDPAEMLSLLVPLKRLAMDTGWLVLVLHHNAKSSNQYSGSTAIAAVADYLLNWTSDKEKLTAKLSLEGRCEYQSPLCFRYDTALGRNIFQGTAVERKDAKAKDKLEHDLFEVLKSVGSAQESATTAADVERAVGSRSRSVRRKLDAAFDKKLVARDGTGNKNSPHRYWRTGAGDELLRRLEGEKLVTGE